MSVVVDLRRVLARPEMRGLLVVFLVANLLTQLYTQAVPLVFEAAGVSASVLGVAWSVTKAVDVAVSPVVGFVSDAFDREVTAAVALAALAAPFAGFLVADGVVALTLLMVVVTALHALVNNAGTAGVNEALESGSEGTGWGVRDVSLYLGSALGLVGGAAVVETTAEVRLVFPFLAAVAAIGCGAVVWGGGVGVDQSAFVTGARRIRRALRRLRTPGVTIRSAFEPARAAIVAPIRSFREVSDWRLLARFCAVKGLVAFGWGMSWFLLPVFAVDVGLSEGNYFLLFAAANVLAMPLSLAGGILADRRSRKLLFVGNYAVEALVLASFAVTRDPALFVLGMALFAAQTLFEPGVIAYFFAQFEEGEAGRIWSVSGVVVKTVGIVAPVVGGALYTISPQSVFLVGSVFVAAGALLAVTLP